MDDETALKSNETDFIFDKKIVCPICNREFTTKQVKTGKARFLGTDEDLRPRYSGIDTIKYDVLLCTHCGYAAVSREFNNVTPKQRQVIRTEIGEKFHASLPEQRVYSYDLAIRRYKMALLTAMTKPAKLSECSYLCLKLAWLYQGAAEEINQQEEPDESRIEKYQKGAAQYKKEAYEGFEQALAKEYPPICGMDEATVSYLMSVLAYECGDFDNSQRYAYMVIGSGNASAKIKNRQRELLGKVKVELKKK